MAPVPNLVKTYAEWLVLDYKVILIGHRRYVDANQIEPFDVLSIFSLTNVGFATGRNKK